MVIRETYLKRIRPFYDVDLIKVITGIRRCGKSTILRQIMDEIIKSGVKESNIIYINLEFPEYFDIKTYRDLYEYINKKIVNNDKYYLFIDEIQNVDHFEEVLNAYKAKYQDKISIFITGSNSDLLSGELATLLAGRYVSFKISPFSFKEVCEFKHYELDKYKLDEQFDDYLTWGGLPQRFSLNSETEIRTYLLDVYNSIIIKDIVTRFKVKDIDLFNRVTEYNDNTSSNLFGR